MASVFEDFGNSILRHIPPPPLKKPKQKAVITHFYVFLINCHAGFLIATSVGVVVMCNVVVMCCRQMEYITCLWKNASYCRSLKKL